MLIRRARRADIAAIVAIYGLDPLTGYREIVADPLPGFYLEAFDAIDRDSNQLLLVAEDGSEILGSVQVTFIQHLISRGLRRAVIEAFFVRTGHTGKGVGTALFDAVVEAAREGRCIAIELTSNKSREGSHGFYAKLGFRASHEGFKLSMKDVPVKDREEE